MTTTSASVRVAGLARQLFCPGYWLMVAGLVAADLLTKSWAWGYVERENVVRYPFEGWDWIAITRLYNSGGVFGTFQDQTLPLMIFRILACGVILWLIARQPRENRRGIFTLFLLFAGALGNLYDNLSKYMPWPGNGFVRDFVLVDLNFWPFDPWPVFNLADSCITIGFLLLITGIAKVQVARPEPAGE